MCKYCDRENCKCHEVHLFEESLKTEFEEFLDWYIEFRSLGLDLLNAGLNEDQIMERILEMNKNR